MVNRPTRKQTNSCMLCVMAAPSGNEKIAAGADAILWRGRRGCFHEECEDARR